VGSSYVTGADDPFVVLNILRLLGVASSEPTAEIPTTDCATGSRRRHLIRTLISLSYTSAAVQNLENAVPLFLEEARDESLEWKWRVEAMRALLNLSKVDRLRPFLMDNDAVYMVFSVSKDAPRELAVRVLGTEILANMAENRRCVEDMVTQGVGDYLDEVVATNKRVIEQARLATKWALAAKASIREVDHYMPMAEREKLATSRRRVTMAWANASTYGDGEDGPDDDAEAPGNYAHHWSVTGKRTESVKKRTASFQAQYLRVLEHGVRVQLHWDSSGELGHGSAPRLLRSERAKRRSSGGYGGDEEAEEAPGALLFEPTNQNGQMIEEHGHHEWSATIMETTAEQKLSRMRCPFDTIVRIQREPSEAATFFQVVCTDRHLLVQFRDHDMCELVGAGLESLLQAHVDGQLQREADFEERVEHYDRKLRAEGEEESEGGESLVNDATYYPEDAEHRQQETYLYKGSETHRSKLKRWGQVFEALDRKKRGWVNRMEVINFLRAANKGQPAAKAAIVHLEADLGIPREEMIRSQMEHSDVFEKLFRGIVLETTNRMSRGEFMRYMNDACVRTRKVRSELLPGTQERAYNLNRPLAL